MPTAALRKAVSKVRAIVSSPPRLFGRRLFTVDEHRSKSIDRSDTEFVPRANGNAPIASEALDDDEACMNLSTFRNLQRLHCPSSVWHDEPSLKPASTSGNEADSRDPFCMQRTPSTSLDSKTVNMTCQVWHWCLVVFGPLTKVRGLMGWFVCQVESRSDVLEEEDDHEPCSAGPSPSILCRMVTGNQSRCVLSKSWLMTGYLGCRGTAYQCVCVADIHSTSVSAASRRMAITGRCVFEH